MRTSTDAAPVGAVHNRPRTPTKQSSYKRFITSISNLPSNISQSFSNLVNRIRSAANDKGSRFQRISSLVSDSSKNLDAIGKKGTGFIFGAVSVGVAMAFGMFILLNIVPAISGYYTYVQFSQSLMAGLNSMSFPTVLATLDLVLKDMTIEVLIYSATTGMAAVATSIPDKAFKLGQKPVEETIRTSLGLAGKADQDFWFGYNEKYKSAMPYGLSKYTATSAYVLQVGIARLIGTIGGALSTLTGILTLRAVFYLASTRLLGLPRFGLNFTKELYGAIGFTGIFLWGKKIPSAIQDIAYDAGSAQGEAFYVSAKETVQHAMQVGSTAAVNARQATINGIVNLPSNTKAAGDYVLKHGPRTAAVDAVTAIEENVVSAGKAAYYWMYPVVPVAQVVSSRAPTPNNLQTDTPPTTGTGASADTGVTHSFGHFADETDPLTGRSPVKTSSSSHDSLLGGGTEPAAYAGRRTPTTVDDGDFDNSANDPLTADSDVRRRAGSTTPRVG
jgi:hypothetical protein